MKPYDPFEDEFDDYDWEYFEEEEELEEDRCIICGRSCSGEYCESCLTGVF